MDQVNNVVKFPTKPAIFGTELRKQLTTGISKHTQTPDETVDTVEKIICTYLVAGVRSLFGRLGTQVGKKLTSSIDEAVGN